MKKNILIVKKDVAPGDSKGVARALFLHSNRLESIYPPLPVPVGDAEFRLTFQDLVIDSRRTAFLKRNIDLLARDVSKPARLMTQNGVKAD